MGLLSNLLGNASEVDIAKIQAELEPVLVPGETIGRGFKVFRDLFIFTDHRLILIDRQGITGSKVSYHSVLYRNITQFSVETAGSFDADSELRSGCPGVASRSPRNSSAAPTWWAFRNIWPTACSVGPSSSADRGAGGRVDRWQ